MSDNKRLDLIVFEKALAPSREKAKAFIMAAQVLVNGHMIDKPAHMTSPDDEVTIKAKAHKYVSRGGLKLEKAFEVFDINVRDKTCLDVGASTGGFTDCMLQNGSKKVFSLDVGYGQLDYNLRCDERVVVLERKNARYMRKDWFNSNIDFATMDVSFISVSLILPSLHEVLTDSSNAVILIKPQFEAGREHVGKHGVVRDLSVHTSVINKSIACAQKVGFNVMNLDFSPITGPKGNVEFLLQIKKAASPECYVDDDKIRKIVESAKQTL